MKQYWWGIIPMAVICTAPAAAQVAVDGWSLSGTTRLRFEAIDGQARASFNKADDLVNLRTTLLAQYQTGPLRIAAELWDSRVYNGNRGTPVSTGEVNAVELVQAYVAVKAQGLLGAGSTTTIQAGHFVLDLGSRRLVANDDYRNTTNGFAGVRIDLGAAVWKTTLIYTLPRQRLPDDPMQLSRNAVGLDHEGFDLVLWGGVVSRARVIGTASVDASFYHLGEHDRPGRPTRDRSLNIASLRIIRDPAPRHFDGELEAIAQRGKVSASLAAGALAQPVRAWFAHAAAGYSFGDPWSTRLSVEYDYASGDKPGGTYGRFDTLYGMRRGDLAPAGLYSAILRSNLISPGVRITTAPSRRSDLMATLRPMWLAAREDSFSSTGVRDAGGQSGRYAGTQIDVRARHQPLQWLRLELDGVLLAKGRFLREAPNAPSGRWTRYLSLNVMASL